MKTYLTIFAIGINWASQDIYDELSEIAPTVVVSRAPGYPFCL
jgi:ABC-type Fe3+-hydroxamate transport system substrate-binding protein